MVRHIGDYFRQESKAAIHAHFTGSSRGFSQARRRLIKQQSNLAVDEALEETGIGPRAKSSAYAAHCAESIKQIKALVSKSSLLALEMANVRLKFKQKEMSNQEYVAWCNNHEKHDAVITESLIHEVYTLVSRLHEGELTSAIKTKSGRFLAALLGNLHLTSEIINDERLKKNNRVPYN